MSSEPLSFESFGPKWPSYPLTQKETEGFTEIPLQKSEAQEAKSLQSRVLQIPTLGLEFFKDEECARGLVDFFGIVTMILGKVGPQSKLIPILNIIGTPFYIHHAVKEANERVYLLKLAFKTSQFTKAFFWFGRSIDPIGTSISDIVQPFAGGAQLSGLSKIPFIGVSFSLVFPVILIVFGVIGGAWEAWAMKKTAEMKKQFEEKLKKMDKQSVSSVVSLLEFLKGPKLPSNTGELLEQQKQELKAREFEYHYFTCEERQESIQKRIDSLLITHSLKKIEVAKRGLSSKGISILSETKASSLFKELMSEEVTLATMDKLEGLYEQLISTIQSLDVAGDEINNLLKDLETNFQELTENKREFLSKGIAILDLEKSELYRKMGVHAVFILMATLTLLAGILYLVDPNHQAVAMSFGIIGCGIDILLIISNKKVSEEQFHRFLKSTPFPSAHDTHAN